MIDKIQNILRDVIYYFKPKKNPYTQADVYTKNSERHFYENKS